MCSRTFCRLAFRQTRPKLQNLDPEFLVNKIKKFRYYALTNTELSQNFRVEVFARQYDSTREGPRMLAVSPDWIITAGKLWDTSVRTPSEKSRVSDETWYGDYEVRDI